MEYKYCHLCGKKLILKEIGDEGLVPFCENCNRPYFNNPVCSVLVAVLNDFDEVLLLKQSYVSLTNWVLIAGYLKLGEDLEDAVTREVKEETGIDISDVQYINSYYYEKKEMIMIGFVAKAKTIDFNLNSKEVDQIKWENIHNAISLLREESIGYKLLNNVIDYMNVKKPQDIINQDSFLIRKCILEDINKIKDLQEHWQSENITMGFVAASIDYLEGKLDEYFLVAELNHEIVGFIYGSVHEAKNLAIFDDNEKYIEIDDLFINQDYRNNGIGNRLLNELLRIASNHGIERAFIYSSTKQIDAIMNFYKKHGFKSWNIQMYK